MSDALQLRVLYVAEGNRKTGFGHLMRSSMLAMRSSFVSRWLWVCQPDLQDLESFFGEESFASDIPAFLRERLHKLDESGLLLQKRPIITEYDLLVVDAIGNKHIYSLHCLMQSSGKPVVSLSPSYEYNHEVDAIVSRFELSTPSTSHVPQYSGPEYFIPGADTLNLFRNLRSRPCSSQALTGISIVVYIGGGDRAHIAQRLCSAAARLANIKSCETTLIIVDPCIDSSRSCVNLFSSHKSPIFHVTYVSTLEQSLLSLPPNTRLGFVVSSGISAYEISQLQLPYVVVDEEAMLWKVSSLGPPLMLKSGKISSAQEVLSVLIGYLLDPDMPALARVSLEHTESWPARIDKVLLHCVRS